MPPTQDTRTARLTTPLGEDRLLFMSLNAFERIGAPFEYRVAALSESPDIDPKDLLGKPCSASYHDDAGVVRSFHGLCAGLTYGGTDRGGFVYHLTLRPEFWFLSRNTDTRIFQDMSVPEIISDVLNRRGLNRRDITLEGSYPKRVFCVQYRESDFDFLSRLMEEEGIFYFFRMDTNGHRLVIADRKSIHQTATGYDALPYVPSGPAGEAFRERDHLDEWSPHVGLGTAKRKFTDFNFETPEPMKVEEAAPSKHDRDDVEKLDHPGGFADRTTGARYAKVRLEADRALRHVVSASGDAVGLIAGSKFSLTEHQIDRENADYVVLEARHRIQGDSYHSGAMGGGPPRVDILAIPADTPFRMPLDTARPRIIGAQTAIVTGKGGEEIETDKYGRIKVAFHWDTYGSRDEKSSCWIRVAQGLAGARWGALFTPRVGQEVIVEFIDGNPDRPLVTGCVYNGRNDLPYSLPGEKTKSTIKTDSSKGGGGFNELRFEDKAGSEEIYIHAQKDQTVEILNDLKTTITNNETRTIQKGDRTTTFDKGNDTLKITMGNHAIKIDAGSQTTEAMQSIELKVGASSIVINQSGITIKAPMVTVEGMSMAKVTGPTTIIDGTGMLVAKGGTVMIN